jgi:hypothetical protein
MIFLDKQHQAMLYLKGNLFETFPVIMVGNLTTPPPKKCFFAKFKSLLRGLWVLVAFLLPFPSWTGLL